MSYVLLCRINIKFHKYTKYMKLALKNIQKQISSEKVKNITICKCKDVAPLLYPFTCLSGDCAKDFCGKGILLTKQSTSFIFLSEILTCTNGSPPDTFNLKIQFNCKVLWSSFSLLWRGKQIRDYTVASNSKDSGHVLI